MGWHVLELDDEERDMLAGLLVGMQGGYAAPAARVYEKLQHDAPGTAVGAIREAVEILGTHDGSRMSGAPARAVEVLEGALSALGLER